MTPSVIETRFFDSRLVADLIRAFPPRRPALSVSLESQDPRRVAVSRNQAKRTSAGWIELEDCFGRGI